MLGIWPRNADKAEVNTAHVNHSGTAIATGDDSGCVKLFDQFPVAEKLVSKRKIACTCRLLGANVIWKWQCYRSMYLYRTCKEILPSSPCLQVMQCSGDQILSCDTTMSMFCF